MGRRRCSRAAPLTRAAAAVYVAVIMRTRVATTRLRVRARSGQVVLGLGETLAGWLGWPHKGPIWVIDSCP